MLGRAKVERAEVRRLIAWFDGKFQREVTQHLLEEKVTKRLFGRGGPDSNALRAGKANIHVHLHYISWLIDRRNWLAGDEISARRPRRRRAPVVPRLSGRRAVGRASCGQGMVRAAQVAPQLPPAAGRPLARHSSAGALRESGFLSGRTARSDTPPVTPALSRGPLAGRKSRG